MDKKLYWITVLGVLATFIGLGVKEALKKETRNYTEIYHLAIEAKDLKEFLQSVK